MSTLSETNPFLKDKKTAKMQNLRSTRTSCGVEGIIADSSVKIRVKADISKTKAIFNKIQSRLKKV